jgi:ABC-type lipoprotein release transport system permease subunit
VGVTQTHGIDMASWGGDQANDMGFQGLNLPLTIVPRLQGDDVVLGLIAILITSLLASIWPTWMAAHLEPMEALRA